MRDTLHGFYTLHCMLVMHLHDSICYVVSLQAAETPVAAPEVLGDGLSRGGLAAIIVAACIVGLSLLAAAALVVRRRQVRSLIAAVRVGMQQRIPGSLETAFCVVAAALQLTYAAGVPFHESGGDR